ncbi:MAG TPA: cupin domain-containing protein [Gammaproteobacteria bacterium]
MSEQQRTSILGDIEASDFLRSYWQKKPLLIRGALPGFESPLGADELAGLACEDGIESRLIERHGDRYVLENGPFEEKRFAKLATRNWTLLVQDIEKHLPDLAGHLDLFDFIPHWRIDDLMISCAAEGGGVGPHVDAYDVFLLQAKGKRRWSIAEHFDPEIIPDMDVRVLKNFTPEQDWVLEPGDMLYLPPNVAHEGVALDGDCMTWSIGFRAPSVRDMLSDFTEWLHEKLPEDKMYADPDLAPWEAGNGKISPTAFMRMRRLLRDAMLANDLALDRWFGQFMTEPKPWLRTEASEELPDEKAFGRRFEAGDELLRDSRALLAWSPFEQGALLFVNGEAWDLPPGLEGMLESLCTDRRYTTRTFESTLDGDGVSLLHRLHREGVLHFASSVED